MQLSWRADGTLATGDCLTLLRRARKRGLLAFAAAAPLIIAAELWSGTFGLRALAETFGESPDAVAPGRRTRSLRVMGAPAPPEPPLVGDVAPAPPAPPPLDSGGMRE